MLGIIKKMFFTAITFFGCNVLIVNALKCVSINNQEFKVGAEITNINSNEPLLYPYSTLLTISMQW